MVGRGGYHEHCFKATRVDDEVHELAPRLQGWRRCFERGLLASQAGKELPIINLTMRKDEMNFFICIEETSIGEVGKLAQLFDRCRQVCFGTSTSGILPFCFGGESPS